MIKAKNKPEKDASSGLHMVVCIKPVPDPDKWSKLKLDPVTMLLSRGEIPPVINALDRNAIEQALLFKARHGGTVDVITMAPPGAADQLREALAMGCDGAWLLTDPAFAGADTLATARCLAAGIKKIGGCDIIFCGGYSLDGSTAQVGPQIAELLELPDLTHAIKVELDHGILRAECKLENGVGVYESELPVLITLDREANVPRRPNMTGIRAAMDMEIKQWTAAGLGLDPVSTGLAGSPTQMLNIFTPALGRKGDMFQGTADEMARQLLTKLRAEQILK